MVYQEDAIIIFDVNNGLENRSIPNNEIVPKGRNNTNLKYLRKINQSMHTTYTLRQPLY